MKFSFYLFNYLMNILRNLIYLKSEYNKKVMFFQIIFKLKIIFQNWNI